MKLLRLTTENTNSIFDNNLNDELILKPNSKIGLQSLTMETDSTKITINSQNSKVNFSITPTINEEISLPYGTYTKENKDILINAFTSKLNEVMMWVFDNPRRYLGLQWYVEENKQNKINIYMKYATIINPLADASLWKIIGEAEVTSQGVFRKKAGEPSTFDLEEYIYSPFYMAQGNGYVRCKLDKYLDSGLGAFTNGYIVGITELNPEDLNGQPLTVSDFKLGIWVGHTDGNYRYIQDGNMVNTSIAYNYYGTGDGQNDFQEVTLNGSELQCNVYNFADGADPTLLHSEDLQYTLEDSGYGLPKYYSVVALRGNDNDARVSNIRFTPSPTQKLTSSSSEVEVGLPPAQNKTAQISYLNFGSPELAEFFGFNNPNNPQIPNSYVVSEPDYTADNTFEPIDIADAYLVEMLNMKLESYDGFVQQRKNILAVIPQNNNNDDGLLQYSPPYLSMIDLNNASDIPLRNIKCRVVKADYTPVELRGLGTIALIIDN